jgi:hypothetical protein
MLFAPAQRLIDMALSVGYDGVQMLPIRGATGLESGVLFFEDAWNAVWTLSQALRHGKGAAGSPSRFRDWVVSPDPYSCERVVRTLWERRIPQVCHSLKELWPERLLEVHPDLGLTAAEIAEQCKRDGFRLALDTLHFRRLRRDGGENPLCDECGRWQPAVATLAPYVQAIHVNTANEDARYNRMTEGCAIRFLDRSGAAGITEMTLVAEYNPLLPRLPKIRTRAQARAKAAEELARLKRIAACG